MVPSHPSVGGPPCTRHCATSGLSTSLPSSAGGSNVQLPPRPVQVKKSAQKTKAKQRKAGVKPGARFGDSAASHDASAAPQESLPDVGPPPPSHIKRKVARQEHFVQSAFPVPWMGTPPAAPASGASHLCSCPLERGCHPRGSQERSGGTLPLMRSASLLGRCWRFPHCEGLYVPVPST